jgi:hypothetical protein
MAKKAATKAEKAYYARVVDLGCLICEMPAEIHHITTARGFGGRASNDNVYHLVRDITDLEMLVRRCILGLKVGKLSLEAKLIWWKKLNLYWVLIEITNKMLEKLN